MAGVGEIDCVPVRLHTSGKLLAHIRGVILCGALEGHRSELSAESTVAWGTFEQRSRHSQSGTGGGYNRYEMRETLGNPYAILGRGGMMKPMTT